MGICRSLFDVCKVLCLGRTVLKRLTHRKTVRIDTYRSTVVEHTSAVFLSLPTYQSKVTD